jgi:hypothetical protein|nr:MAG TPA: hypothetical protein [Caudoviricetes sp.]
MDRKLIAKYLSKGGFKETSIVLDSGRVTAAKNSAVSGVRRKGVAGQTSSAVKVGSGNTEVSNATAVTATQSGITGASNGVSSVSVASTGDMIKFSPTDDFSSLYNKVKLGGNETSLSEIGKRIFQNAIQCLVSVFRIRSVQGGVVYCGLLGEDIALVYHVNPDGAFVAERVSFIEGSRAGHMLLFKGLEGDKLITSGISEYLTNGNVVETAKRVSEEFAKNAFKRAKAVFEDYAGISTVLRHIDAGLVQEYLSGKLSDDKQLITKSDVVYKRFDGIKTHNLNSKSRDLALDYEDAAVLLARLAGASLDGLLGSDTALVCHAEYDIDNGSDIEKRFGKRVTVELEIDKQSYLSDFRLKFEPSGKTVSLFTAPSEIGSVGGVGGWVLNVKEGLSEAVRKVLGVAVFEHLTGVRDSERVVQEITEVRGDALNSHIAVAKVHDMCSLVFAILGTQVPKAVTKTSEKVKRAWEAWANDEKNRDFVKEYCQRAIKFRERLLRFADRNLDSSVALFTMDEEHIDDDGVAFAIVYDFRKYSATNGLYLIVDKDGDGDIVEDLYDYRAGGSGSDHELLNIIAHFDETAPDALVRYLMREGRDTVALAFDALGKDIYGTTKFIGQTESKLETTDSMQDAVRDYLYCKKEGIAVPKRVLCELVRA